MERIQLLHHHKMFLEALKASPWYKFRPQCIKDAIELRPPVMAYSVRGKMCSVVGYEEPDSKKVEDVTVIVKPFIYVEGEDPTYGEEIADVKLEELKQWPAGEPPSTLN
jgi:hypothetical protein